LVVNTGRINRGSEQYRTIRTRMFSDTVIISSREVSDESVNRVVGMAMIFQLNAVINGFLLRGAVVVDDYFEHATALFGPAVISAYNLEHVASWPRVVVGPSTLETMSAKYLLEARSDYLLQGDDGLLYVDYLRDLFLNLTVWRAESQESAGLDPLDLVLHHMNALVRGIESATTQKNLGILSKYHAAASYHNAAVNRLLSWMPHTPDLAELKQSPGIDTMMRLMEENASRDSVPAPQLEDGLQKVAQSLYEDRKLLESYKIDMTAYFPQFHELSRLPSA